MIQHFFLEKIYENFAYEPNDEQKEALSRIVDFLFDKENESIFVLKGYAGTGKSSLIGAMVKTMTEMKQKTVLLAPTGRAAKVFSAYADHSAYTIHRKIYRQKRFSNEPTGFVSVDNLHKDTLFIVDEASMISNGSGDSFIFGTGRLLDDLIQYVYTGENCKLMLIGDTAQLPPIGQEDSPALNEEVLRSYGLLVSSFILTQIVRQENNSGILYNATFLREAIEKNRTDRFPILKLSGFSDIVNVSGDMLIEEISSAYDRDGIMETIVLSRSNKRSNIYNEGIRNRILYREEEITAGDLLMITKNNYYWSEGIEQVDFLANGEMVEVLRVKKITELYGFKFCDVLVRHIDYDIELDLRIMLDTLRTDTSGLTKEQSDRLFYTVLEDYSDITTRSGKMKKMKADPYFNALQVKYGYAITCHKAQGGEWKNVFLDLGYVTEEYMDDNFYRWLYTAFTRASQKLYLVNFPDNFFG
ncbi:MAG: ATP-dependent RecD-like DNA helicase [Dysgonomonas sp.]